MPLSGARWDAPYRANVAPFAATPRDDARTTAGTWTREGTGRKRQRGAVRVSCEELTYRDGAGGTPAPRLGDGSGTVGVDDEDGLMSRLVGVGETPTPRPRDVIGQ